MTRYSTPLFANDAMVLQVPPERFFALATGIAHLRFGTSRCNPGRLAPALLQSANIRTLRSRASTGHGLNPCASHCSTEVPLGLRSEESISTRARSRTFRKPWTFGHSYFVLQILSELNLGLDFDKKVFVDCVFLPNAVLRSLHCGFCSKSVFEQVLQSDSCIQLHNLSLMARPVEHSDWASLRATTRQAVVNGALRNLRVLLLDQIEAFDEKTAELPWGVCHSARAHLDDLDGLPVANILANGLGRNIRVLTVSIPADLRLVIEVAAWIAFALKDACSAGRRWSLPLRQVCLCIRSESQEQLMQSRDVLQSIQIRSACRANRIQSIVVCKL
ncbi:hypothetical protein BKA62DRAFT_67962 [Auriculariales sp. MPI-PUGE-AT-0066]|nr:hypothetical protein BKA62DRAFT_67962 [Auriculariales sp. MPI-PUGE-AT-0066]